MLDAQPRTADEPATPPAPAPPALFNFDAPDVRDEQRGKGGRHNPVAKIELLAILLIGGVAALYYFVLSDTRCAEEELVKAHILEEADDPKSVEFIQWGPHDLTGELGLNKWVGWRPHHADKNRPLKVLRVVYRENVPARSPAVRLEAKERFDMIFAVQNGKVLTGFGNEWGDNWKQGSRQYFAPGMEK